jgi:hypothetical protein
LRPSVRRVMDDARYFELLPFPFLINPGQQNAQYVSWQTIVLVAH